MTGTQSFPEKILCKNSKTFGQGGFSPPNKMRDNGAVAKNWFSDYIKNCMSENQTTLQSLFLSFTCIWTQGKFWSKNSTLNLIINNQVIMRMSFALSLYLISSYIRKCSWNFISSPDKLHTNSLIHAQNALFVLVEVVQFHSFRKRCIWNLSTACKLFH